ncbi:Dot/Icm T4SS effector [Legionella santicrucis]|uniref:Dot/Icm T4SS effector n=1 Tax=Legionella santicrucis TaxID=45074 RepID=A0A0W0YX53_9GAMM|nr:hypothetical protein [Legionella santicrucis]KTD61485.1 Dot/Icm T4SS effector [Legionella santicrucis]
MKIALVDIDGCLVQKGQLNSNIVKRIKEENYDQVILFTQRSKYIQSLQLPSKFLLNDEGGIITTEEAVKKLEEQLNGKKVKVSTSVDEFFGEPCNYYEAELKKFEQDFRKEYKENGDNANKAPFVCDANEELTQIRTKKGISEVNQDPYSYFPQGKVEQYQFLINRLHQTNSSENLAVDFFDDHIDNLKEVDQSKNINIKPNCFHVTEKQIKSLHIVNQYEHFTDQQSKGRFHLFEATADIIKSYKNNYQNLKGDYLKSQILVDFKKQLEEANNLEDVNKITDDFKKSNEYKILTTGQGLFTKITGIQTSSEKAVDQMVKDRIGELNIPSPALS